MYNITDVTSLGTDYTVSDTTGKVISTIQVIPYTEILSATVGPYNESFENYTVYMEKSIALLSGFDAIEPNSILWYATSEVEVVLSDVIEYAVKNEYTTIILEHLEELE